MLRTRSIVAPLGLCERSLGEVRRELRHFVCRSRGSSRRVAAIAPAFIRMAAVPADASVGPAPADAGRLCLALRGGGRHGKPDRD